MAYSSDYQRKLFETDCSLLIKAITNFKEENESFKILHDFALSNLLFHTYLDVNSHKVKRSIAGLHEKYVVHSDLEKANSFKSTTDELFDIVDKKYGSEKEAYYGIFDLLLNLSHSDYQKTYEPECGSQEEKDPDKSEIDWASYLHEDDVKYVLSDTNSEEFTSEDDSVEEIEAVFLRPPPRDDSGLGISPDSCSGSSQQQFHSNGTCLSLAQNDLQKNTDVMEPKLFYLYWLTKYQKSVSSNPFKLKTMNFTKAWEEQLAVQDAFPSIVKKVIMHERNMIKEILWMLSGVKDLFLFHWNGHKFTVNPVVHMCNLTTPTMSSVLKPFCQYGERFHFLHSFVSEALPEDPSTPNFCRTFNAYVAALGKQMQKLQCFFSCLEKRIRERRETFTLLNLQEKCRCVLQKLDLLYHLNQDMLESIAANCDPLEKSCRILNFLWENLSHFSLRGRTSSSTKIVLTLFLESCKPFFTFLESLIIYGNFKDPHHEFICTRNENIQTTDAEFWEHSLTLNDLSADVADIFFLKPYFKDIIIAGKSIEILNKVHSLLKVEPFRLQVVEGELYYKFIHILEGLCSRNGIKMKISESKIPLSTSTVSCPADENENNVQDPLLVQKIFDYQTSTGKFFQPSVNPVYLPVAKTVPEKLFTELQMQSNDAIQFMVPRKCKPINMCILKSFETCMKYAYHPTCIRLIKALKERYNLMSHLDIIQKYFLMESGDLMFSFYSKVFEKIFYKEHWQDTAFLYSALQNAISEDEENSERLCVFLNSCSEVQLVLPFSQLNNLQLSYEVQWPVSIVLGNTVQNQYCQIFSFLLQIKSAKYMLDELCFIKLCTDEPQSKLSTLMSKFVFPKKQKIHGMYIVRMRLMYFVNGLHNYIMTRILHSFGLEFHKTLTNASTVDEMIVAHNQYLKSLQERCFLDHRLPHLKEQIFQVLSLCYSFQQMWLKGVDAVSLEDLENIERQFSQYSCFLFSYFNTSLRRGVYINLQSLVSSTLSDTHSFHIFKAEKSIPSSTSARSKR